MSSVICAGCGHANAAGARFCAQCGSSLTLRCGSCGAELEASARFCTSCGATVDGDAAAGLDGALKVVSVVFSDLVGSTALQETLEPESVGRVMARFYEAMRVVVERHGGAIQKFIGDAVVAVFGVPSVSEDDALRATRCAAAMTAALAALNDELEQAWGVRLQIRTGVNTGELAISAEGIFVGDTMNTAARLEQAADAGGVLLGEATWRLVRHEVEVEEIAPLELKGKAQPIRVWRLVSIEPRGAAATEAPLVGRTAELQRLRSGLEQAIAAQACKLVTVIGSPGLGKSRLATEFARSLEGEALVLEGHCESTGEGITFLPVADVLRAAAAIADDDSPEQVAAKLTETVVEGPDRERIVARVAGLLGAGPPAAPEETFWGVRAVLESLAREQPLVVVFDDVHRGQPMFLDLIEHLVEWVRDAAILLVALARPELRETRQALAAAGRRPVDVIELDPLAPDQSRELVGGLLGQVDVPDELLERILETTDGNPLFLGELLRMLVDDGSLERDGDVWVAAGGAEALQVPPTIQALLTARIERLRADERSVVERAAVIGKQFYRGAVAELVAPPIRSGIDGHLETLRRKDMVEPDGTYWIDEPVYRFHHVLIRDAAYHLLLKEARAELHEKFANWLETKAGELVGEHEEVIAYHLEQAHEYRRQLGPLDDRGRAIGTRAAAMFGSAGRRALAREDLAAAANLLQRALDRDPEADVLWDLAEALLSAGDTGRAADAIARLSGPRGDVLAAQLAVSTGTGSLEEALARVTAATEALAAAGAAAAEAKGHHVTAQVQAQLGRVADVETSLDRALLAARKADDRRRITAVLAAAPRAALWGPSPVVRASGRCLDVVRVLRMTPGNRHVEAVALRCQAVLEAMRGRADAAREILAGGRATLEELGLTLELHELAMHAGIVELLAGRPGGAEELMRNARDGFAALGLSVSAAQAAALLARALVEQGRDEEALAETEYAEQHAGGDLKTTITWLGVRAEALARRDGADQALELARRAVSLADPTDALADKADANMALARVLRVAGRPDDARAAAEVARALYRSKDHAVGVEWAGELAQATPDLQRPAPPPAGSPLSEDPELAALFARHGEAVEELRQAQNARDYRRIADLVTDDWYMVDHRALGWPEAHGRERCLADLRSVYDASPTVRLEYEEIVAADHQVVVTRNAWRGRGLKAGEHEVRAGAVHLIRDGRWAGVDFYEPDDRQGMIARYAELGGGAGLLGNSSLEQISRAWVRAYGMRDLDRLAELVVDDWVLIDHRGLGWEELRGREAWLEGARAAYASAADIRVEIREVLALDDRVIASIDCWRGTSSPDIGGGSFEYTVGHVSVVENGRFVSVDQYDPDDRKAMLARYRELGGTASLPGDRAAARLMAEVQSVLNARDYERLAELVADDWYFVDHRALGWEEGRGRDDCVAIMRSMFDASPHVRFDLDEVLAADDRLMVSHAAVRGHGRKAGEHEVVAGAVYLMEDGLWAGVDFYEPDDREAMLARYEELGGRREAVAGDRPPERFYAEYSRRWAAADKAGIVELVDEDWLLTDRRSLALWEEMRGREGASRIAASAFAGVREPRFTMNEVLACDDSVIAARVAWSGRGYGGAQFSNEMGAVSVIRNGLEVSMDVYDPDDRQAMIARYAELGGGAGKLRDRPPEEVSRRFVRAFGTRDFEALAELVTDDISWVDHRALPWEIPAGRDAWLSVTRFAFERVADIRVEVDEVHACDERVIASVFSWRGTASSGGGGGPYELSVGHVTVVENGRIARVEQYDPDDREAMLARYQELGARG